ncbi:MAG: RidA family protein [Bacteroidetes bacterium]|nr:RidA family protein [Bacteroidota bacterium]
MIEEKIKELGYEIPQAPKPVASYIPAIQVGDLVMTAGQIPFLNGEVKFTGQIGKELTVEEGMDAARLCALNCLSVIKDVIGDLDKIERIVKLTVFVSGIEGAGNQPKVANGASDFIVNVFGDNGKHVRAAVGVSGLPLNVPVEIEMIAQLKK